MARRNNRLATGLMALALMAGTDPARAQDPAPAAGYTADQASEAATLLADRITVTGDKTLVAEGAVEVFWQQNRLTASRVTYDQSTDRMLIEGPIRLVQPGQSGAVTLASQADLSRDMQNGVLIGARMVLARELQIAANRVERRDGEVTTLYDAVGSSCQVCASDPTPLWEIRARTITHDAPARVLRFDNAQFRLMGVPLLWTPVLSMPDPTVDRMDGILRPRFTNSSRMGFGVELPYFLTLGPSADLTLKPFVATDWSSTLGMRYRQALDNGYVLVNGALSHDSLRENETRGYLFANGWFGVQGGYQLGVQLQVVTDPAYLVDYDISDIDRLWSGVTLDRVTRNEMIWMRAGNTHSIREGESNSTQPMLAGDYSWTRLFRPRYLGGLASVEWNVHTLNRASTLDYDTAEDYDDVPDGRDMLRTSLELNWQRNWLLPAGILATSQARLATDVFSVRNDQVYEGDTIRAQPTLGMEVRWPWVATSGSASHVIEPVAQILWSPDNLKAAPNEDSVLVEFDEGNLFSLSRYPGGDTRERDLRANLGMSWTRMDAAGWSFGMTAGRVFRAEDLDQFSTGSGLSGRTSDWLLGGTLTTTTGLTISNRALFDDELDISRDELRFAYLGPKYQLTTGYIWMKPNELEGRPQATDELVMMGGVNMNPEWRGTFNTRYDFTAERMARAGLGLRYANECIAMDLSLSRRFTSSSSVKPETSFGFQVQLAGFGSDSQTGTAARACRG
ncbi:LPS-assembly protein LptD [Sinirhodobacter populi]|uniref:LPS-assembly protein LptD n=1 Tax=Paenirhodobacter populi TaxID=2306993 RepID=A0A443KN21_9RHOB|nr:LPS assembly protein LptD [Sinirhodobacter populi]RWR34165.1 LPS-assembly protein LptD [Sinirhodobacter populi]